MGCGSVRWADAAAIGYHHRRWMMSARFTGLFSSAVAIMLLPNLQNGNLPP
jgi:hypothetical protein